MAWSLESSDCSWALTSGCDHSDLQPVERRQLQAGDNQNFSFLEKEIQAEGGQSVNREHLTSPRLTGHWTDVFHQLTGSGMTLACKRSIRRILKHSNEHNFLHVIAM